MINKNKNKKYTSILICFLLLIGISDSISNSDFLLKKRQSKELKNDFLNKNKPADNTKSNLVHKVKSKSHIKNIIEEQYAHKNHSNFNNTLSEFKKEEAFFNNNNFLSSTDENVSESSDFNLSYFPIEEKYELIDEDSSGVLESKIKTPHHNDLKQNKTALREENFNVSKTSEGLKTRSNSDTKTNSSNFLKATEI